MIRHGFKTGAAALALAASLASAAPAEARGLRGGFGAGLLFGALAAGALAAAAERAEARAYAALPEREALRERPLLLERRVLPEERIVLEEEVPRAAGRDRGRRPVRAPSASARDAGPARAASVRAVERRPAETRQVETGAAETSAVETCGRSLIEASRPYGGVSVRAAPAGPAVRAGDGSLTVPLDARVAYAGSPERRARVACRLDSGGRVVALR